MGILLLLLLWAGLQWQNSRIEQPAAPLVLAVLQDPAIQTPQQAMSQPTERWQPYHSSMAWRHDVAHGIWFRLQMASLPDHALHVRAPGHVQAQLFTWEALSQQQLYANGELQPLAKQLTLAEPLWRLPNASAEQVMTYLLYIEQPRIQSFEFRFLPANTLEDALAQRQLWHMLWLGISVVSIILASVMCFLGKGPVSDGKNYLWLVGFSVSAVAILVQLQGIAPWLLTHGQPALVQWLNFGYPLLLLSVAAIFHSLWHTKIWRNLSWLLQGAALLWFGLTAIGLGLPDPDWQAMVHQVGGYSLLLMVVLGVIGCSVQVKTAPWVVLGWWLPTLAVLAVLLQAEWSTLFWPWWVWSPWMNIDGTIALLLLGQIVGLLVQRYWQKANLQRSQQRLLERNQQLALLQQQEIERSRISPFYQLGSRLALTELLHHQFTQTNTQYHLLLIEFQQFDALEAVLGARKTSTILQAYLAELTQFCQQHSPAIVNLGKAPWQSLYALSASKCALLVQSADLVQTLSQIRQLLHRRISIEGLAPDMKPRYASVAVNPSLAADAEALLAHGLLALSYANTVAGYVNYQPQLEQQSLQRLSLITDLAKAIELKQLSLAFQPIQDLSSQQMTSLEAFIRWHHPQLGAVSPAIFIPLAEETGLIHALTRWVYLQVRHTQDRLFELGYQLPIAMNVAAVDLDNHRLIRSILQHEQQYSAEQRIKFELTEGALQRDSVAAKQSLALLGAAKTSLIVDDFGAGQSVFVKLAGLAVDELKIDMAMLKMLGTQREVVLAAAIRLGKSLAKRVICEGVESQPQYDFLMLHNVDAVQGYFIGRPMPASELEAWLATQVRQKAAPQRA